MAIYNEYQYLWPPRPTRAVPQVTLGYYEANGWLAQVKKNGTCTLIFVGPDRIPLYKTRHNEMHKQWIPTKAVNSVFSGIPGQGWYVFVAELLHSKTPGIKNVLYIFDILVDSGEYLLGMNIMERHERIRRLWSSPVTTLSHYTVNDNIWVARFIRSKFREKFEQLVLPEDEGLVLKNAATKLITCHNANANSVGQVKCRKPTKNFGY